MIDLSIRQQAAYREVPHGQRKCEECTFYHPERTGRPCSVFRELQNKKGDCSAYIDDGGKVGK